MLVFARGLHEAAAHPHVLPRRAADPPRDPLLTAHSERAGAGRPERGRGDLRFDIHLQGDSQTAFFAL